MKLHEIDGLLPQRDYKKEYDRIVEAYQKGRNEAIQEIRLLEIVIDEEAVFEAISGKCNDRVRAQAISAQAGKILRAKT